MKKLFIPFFVTVLLLSGSYHNSYAQAVNKDDVTASLGISKGIIKLIGSLAKDYADIKGNLLTKTGDGTSVYSVNGADGMMAENQYVMIKSGGAAYYIGNYSGDKNVTMSFAAFTAGVTTLTNADGNFTIAQDKVKSTDEKLVYIMSVKGTKVGSYSLETKKKEGTLIVGFL